MKITSSLFQKYNLAVPRYTSYPPATAFSTTFSNDQYIDFLKLSNQAEPQNISIYIHIPFCTQRCHFCGCNTASSQSDEVLRRYISAVITEIKMVGKYIDKNRLVTQVSWGGGTPNSIKLDYVQQIMSALRNEFCFADYAEIAMECNPAYLDYADVDVLHAMGFNRLSLGIQDFHADVLKAINRKAPKHPVADMIQYLKSKGFKGVNLDLVYGLPLQTPEKFRENIEQAIAIHPDRIATFSYAHIPWFNKAQKLMEKHPFPSPDEKLEMLVDAINHFSANGYDVIGMDHFACHDDDLSIAKKNKQLQRNFQGYNTRKTTGQVYAFGASGIGQLHGAYIQNIKQYAAYTQAIESGNFAVERGYALNRNEIVIRDTINEIMCNGELNFEEMAQRFSCTKEEYLTITQFDELKLSQLLTDQLIYLTDNTLNVTPQGMMIVRNVAVAFDPAFEIKAGQYSNTI